MKKIITFLLITTFACQPKPVENSNSTEANEPQNVPSYPELLTKALTAHGGIDKWKKFNSLSYKLESTLGEEKIEHQLIDLNSRKVRIEGDQFILGMDGKNVWVSPNKAAFGKMSARFYHNLIFYFFSIPYVLADPGIQYEDLGTVSVEDKSYRALKISYDNGIGDASNDLYIAHFNPETYKLELLLYTVTYFSGEKHEKYNALKYTKWQEVNGLLVPKVLEGYKYEDGKFGDKRYQTIFTEVQFNEQSPDSTKFEMPEQAEIDSLRAN